MNQSPKARFLEQKALAKQFLDVVDSEAFTRATELAMLALMEELNRQPPTAEDRYHQLQGAQKFLDILKSLPVESQPLPARVGSKLNHDLR